MVLDISPMQERNIWEENFKGLLFIQHKRHEDKDKFYNQVSLVQLATRFVQEVEEAFWHLNFGTYLQCH
jgi:hypothetical protein